MGPGVPGMGIASIFYVTAALIAPLREVARSFRGESSAQRWRAVGRQFSLAMAILSSIVLLYLGFDALVTHGLLSPPDIADLPGDFPNWTYAIGILMVLVLVLGLVASMVALRARWGPVGDDTQLIADAYRASIPIHEDLRHHGISSGRHRATAPEPVITFSRSSSDPTDSPTGGGHRPVRGRHLREPILV